MTKCNVLSGYSFTNLSVMEGKLIFDTGVIYAQTLEGQLYPLSGEDCQAIIEYNVPYSGMIVNFELEEGHAVIV